MSPKPRSSFGQAKPHPKVAGPQSEVARIAAVQMASGPNVEGNLNEARRLIEIARFEKLERVTVDILSDNRQMIEVCEGLGFHLTPTADGVVQGVLLL